MVAVVSGPGTGLNNTSLTTLNGQTSTGSPNLGPTGETVYVNSANGNLVVQDLDLQLAAVGLDLTMTRTYNSQGYLNGDMGADWQLGVERSVGDLLGTVNTAGSSVVRFDSDGSQATYVYNAALGLYVAPSEGGAYDTLSYNATTQQWTFTNGTTRATDLYNSAGLLLSSSDANGNTDTYTYAGSQLTKITDSSGQVTTLVYSGNNLSEISVATNGTTFTRTYYGYDSLNRLNKVTTDLTPTDNSIADNNTYITNYTYVGATQLLAGITQQSGQSANIVASAAFTYVMQNGLYRLATYTDALGNVTTFTYSQVSVPTTTTATANAAALSTTVPPYYTVKAGDTWSTIAATVYGSSAANLVAALTRAAGDPTLSTGLQVVVPTTLYIGADATYLQTDVVDPLGQDTTYMENSSGQLTSVLSPTTNGVRLQTNYAYDTSGDLLSVTVDPAGLNRVTTYQYDANGNVLQSQDAAGDTVTSTYSATNQLLTQTTYTIPDPGNTGTLSADDPQTTRYVYDANSNLRFTVSPDGRVVEYLYNASGERISSLTFLGALYNVSGLAITASPSLTTMTTWAAAQNLTEIQRIDYTYDFRGLLQTETQYATTDTSGNGVLAGSSETQYVYNPLGQLSQKILSPGSAISTLASNVGPTTTYTFDVFGRPTSVSSLIDTTSTQTTYAYNEILNQTLITFDQSTETPAATHTELDSYNADGELTSSQVTLSTQGPSPATTVNTTTYAYDSLGRLRMTTDPEGVKTYILYDAAGRKVADIDGTGDLTQYVYNSANQVVETIHYSSALAASTLATLVTAQGAPAAVSVATLVASLSSVPGRNAALDQITRSVYDAAGRQVYAIDASGDVTQFVYDGASQLVEQIQYATPVTISPTVGQLLPSQVTVTPNAANDRTTRNFYDPDGLLAGTLNADGYLTVYGYDDADHLVSQTAYATVTNSSLWATGSLASLIPAASPTQDITTRYFYDNEGRRVGILDGDGYLTQTVYDNAGDVAQTIRYQNAVTYTAGETLAQVSAAATGINHVTSYQYDGDQRLIQTTNYEGTVDTTTYDGAGNAVSTTTAAGNATDARTIQSRYNGLGQIVQQLTAQGSALITGGMTSAQIQAIWTQYSVHYTYDPDGQLASTTDQLGNTTYFYYDADGRLIYTVNGAGEVQEKDYNALGQLTDSIQYINRISTTGLTGGLIDGVVAGRLVPNAAQDAHTVYTYTLTGQVATSLTAEGSQTTNLYDAFGDVSQRTENINTTQSLVQTFQYDRRGLLTLTTSDPTGVDQTQADAYDAFGRLISTTDQYGNVTRTNYDQLGRVIATYSALNSQTLTTYDAFSRVLTVTDALNNTTTYTYNDAARSVTVTTPGGVAVTTVHNSEGQTVSVTDGNGNTTNYTYDANGNLTETYDALGTLSTETYNAAGLLYQSTDGNGIVTQLGYDAANRVLTRTVDPTGLAETTTYVYDGEGRVTSVTDPRGVQTITTYDRNNRVTTSTIVGGNAGQNIETTYTYDDRGDITVETQGAGSANPQTVTYGYDALGRRISQSVVLGLGQPNAVTQYFYDANGNLTRSINADTQSTWYVYNADNELTYTIDALGGVTQTLDDADGRLISTRRYATPIATTGFGNIVTLAQVGTPATSSTDRLQQTVYNSDGRAVYSINAAGGVTQQLYDGDGNVIQTTAYANAVAAGTYTTVAAVTAALTANAAQDRSQRTVYDTRDRAAFTIDALGDVVRTQYDADGNVAQTTAYATPSAISGNPTLSTLNTWASSNTSANDRTTRYWYDSMDRVVLTQNAAGYLTATTYNDAALTKQSISYATKVTIAAGANTAAAKAAIVTSANDQNTLVTYDKAGQIVTQTNVSLGLSQSYTYDAVGNRITYTNQNGATWTYVYDANHRLIQQQSPQVAVTTSGYTGKAGNLQASAPVMQSIVTYMTYDAVGNVLSQTEAYGTAQARTTSYQYDALGRQIRTTYPPMSVYNPAADSASNAGSAVVREETTVTPFSTVVYNTLGDAVVSEDVSGNYTHKVYDQLGRVIYEVDPYNTSSTTAEATAYVTAYTYDAFGNQTQLTRYSNALNVTGLTESAAWTAGQVTANLTPNASLDRTVLTSYDLLNRQIQVTQPTVLNYLPTPGAAPGGSSITYGAITLYDYDAFGDVIRSRQLVNPNTSTYAATYYYYDQRGLQIESVDPLGYLTTMAYDAFGNNVQKIEFAAALATPPTTPGGTPPTAPTPGSNDRQYAYAYDALNRLISQTVLQVATTSISGSTVTPSTTNQLTSYQYDGVGNQIAVTNALGATTYTYYDALGRVVATASPAENVNGTTGGSTTVIPLTVYGRDAFGNLVSQTQYAAGAATATAAGYTIAAAPASPGAAVTFAWTSGGRTPDFSYHLSTSSTVVPVAPVQNGTNFSVSLGSLPNGTYDYAFDTYSGGKGGGLLVSVTGTFSVTNGAASLLTENIASGSVTSIGVTGVAISTPNRVTVNLLDSYGHVLASADPDGNLTETSYDVRGDVAKTWQIVTNPYDSSVEAIVSINTYDGLGRLTTTTTPQNAAATQIAVTSNVYDAFGDVVQQGTYALGSPATYQVYSQYDQAGRLWRTNSGDGVNKIYLYDLQGNQTAEITSDSVDLSSSGSITSAAAALALPAAQQKRTETIYNVDGQALQQRQASFSTPSVSGTPSSLEPITNAAFTMGTLLVPEPPNAYYQAVTVPRGKGGSYTTYVINPTATWANGGGYVQESPPSSSNAQGTYTQVPQTQYQLVNQPGMIYWNMPTDQGITATFSYLVGTTWTPLAVNPVSTTQLGVNVSGLPSGSYQYKVLYTRSALGQSTPFAEATGTFSVTNSTVTSLTSGAATGTSAYVTFAWTSTGKAPDFTYALAGTTNYVQVTPVQNGTNFSVALGTVAAGTYDFYYDTYTGGGKAGLQAVVSGNGVFTVTNGVATLVSQTVSVGTPTNVALSSSIPAVATPSVVQGTVGTGVTVTWQATNTNSVATLSIQQGSGAWTSYTGTLSGSNFSATDSSLTPGTYNYEITEQYNGEIVALGTGTLTYTAGTTSLSAFTPAAAAPLVAPLSGSETSVPGNPSVNFVWTTIAPVNSPASDFDYEATGASAYTYVAPTLASTTTVPGVTTVSSLTQSSGNPYIMAALSGTRTTTNGNPIVGFSWSSTGTAGDFYYKLSTASTYTHIAPTLSGSTFTVSEGTLANGVYDFEYDATRPGGKSGAVTTAAGNGTFTVSNGVATLTTSTITTGTPTAIKVLSTPTGSSSTTTIQWARPADSTVTASFGYRVHGSTGAYTMITPTVGGTTFVGTIANLSAGTYDYEAFNLKTENGVSVTTDESTGEFVVGTSTVTISGQTHTASSFQTVGSSGASLTWTQTPTTGDTITVSLYNATTGVTTPLTVSGSAGSYSASMSGLASGTYSYTIEYLHSGQSTPYTQAVGSVTIATTASQTYDNWSAAIGSLAAGTYNFTYDTTHQAGKSGTATTAAGSGTFSVSGGTATLTSQTVTTGTPTSVGVTSTPGPAAYTTTIQWARPSDTTIYASFAYRVTGSGSAFTTVTPTEGTSNFITTLSGLAFGTYDYEAEILQDHTGGKGGTVTTTLDESTGEFTVSASGVTISGQSHTAPLGLTVSDSGSSLTWSHAPNAGDTILAEVVNTSTEAETILTPTVNGANYTASLFGLPSGSYEYFVQYRASGATSPYLSASGTVTVTSVAAAAVPSAPAGVGNITSFLDGGNGVLYWTTAASAGSTVTFSYRQLGATTWAGTLPVSPDGSGFSVNLSSLSGTIEYEVTYTASGQTIPYIVANGRTTISRTGASTGTLTDTTATTLAGTTVTPSIYQTFDRWGDLLSTTDASGDLTSYAYNQLGEVTQVTLPATDQLSTAGGTIVDKGTIAASESNYYDVLGRLVGTRDADGNLNSTAYNADGLQLSQSDADGGGKQYIYDAFDDQIQVTEEVSSTINYRTRMTYNGDGELIASARELTNNGFLTSNPNVLAGAAPSSVTEDDYTYDGAGRRTSATDGAIGVSGNPETTGYAYNQRGKVTKTTTPLGYVTTYQYDLEGNQTLDTNGDGDSEQSTYDYFGHLKSQTDLGGEVYTYNYNNFDDAQLSSETSKIGTASAENIVYTYDAAGHLTEITDNGAAAGGLAAVNRVTQYTYDSAGRQASDKVTVNGLVNQDTVITYDQQNRISQLNDINYTDVYRYDAAGNRTEIDATYLNYTDATQSSILYYTYDAMNRVLISQGADVSNAVVINTTQGIKLTYDWIGDRLSATQYGQVINSSAGTLTYASGYDTEAYTYDGVGDLLTTTRTETTSGAPVQILSDTRTYDGASHELTDQSVGYTGTTALTAVNQQAFTTYDDDGNVNTQTTYSNSLLQSFVYYGESTDTSPTSVSFTDPYVGATSYAWSAAWGPGYDAAGILHGYIEEVFNNGSPAYTSTDSITYRKAQTYEETGENISSTSGGPLAGSTTYSYDVDNALVGFVDSRSTTGDNDRSFMNDQSGNALTVVQGEYGGSGELTTQQAFADALANTGGYNETLSQRFFYALGQQIGSFGQLQSGGTSGPFTANFDVNYTPVSQAYPTTTPSEVVTLQGDTLQSVASRLYGDPNLWYIIAQENGLTSPSAVLTAGTVLRIPNSVVSLSNNSSTFKPYNASEAIGNTTPTQPLPPPPQSSGGGCGILGEILIIAVAIIVTVYTAGAASEAIGSAVGATSAGTSTFSAGLSALAGSSAAGTGAAVASAAIGGAVGSVASQEVGIAIGQQTGFSWTAVAEAAIGSAATAGVGAYASGSGNLLNASGPLGQYGSLAARAAASEALTQGVSVALGLQSSFNWDAVAAAAIAAPLSAYADAEASNLSSGALSGDVAQQLIKSATTAAVRASFGGKFDVAQVAADAFGNVLANSLIGVATTLHSSAGNGGNPPPENAPQNPPQPPPVAPVTVNPDPSLFAPVTIDPIELSLPRLSVLAQPGDSISTILGTSDPVAIQAFMQANNLQNSTIYAGQPYVLPDAEDYAGSDGVQGQLTLNADNARIAAIQTAAVQASLANAPVGSFSGDLYQAEQTGQSMDQLFAATQQNAAQNIVPLEGVATTGGVTAAPSDSTATATPSSGSSVWSTLSNFGSGLVHGFNNFTENAGEFVADQIDAFQSGGFDATALGHAYNNAVNFTSNEFTLASEGGFGNTETGGVINSILSNGVSGNYDALVNLTSSGIETAANYLNTHSVDQIAYDSGNFVGGQAPGIILTAGAGTVVRLGAEAVGGIAEATSATVDAVGDLSDVAPAANAAETAPQTFYRGDRGGLTEFQSYAAQVGGQANSEAVLANGDLNELMANHALDSSSPPSPFISVTTDPNVARIFAGPNGTVYEIQLDPGRAIPNPFNTATINDLPENEYLVPHYIGPNEIVGTLPR